MVISFVVTMLVTSHAHARAQSVTYTRRERLQTYSYIVAHASTARALARSLSVVTSYKRRLTRSGSLPTSANACHHQFCVMNLIVCSSSIRFCVRVAEPYTRQTEREKERCLSARNYVPLYISQLYSNSLENKFDTV